jgi:ubiquinone/menaquinone biosynthesis C-methylase UbiE
MAWLENIGTGMLHTIASVLYRVPRVSFEARIIEYDFAYRNIRNNSKSQKILDIGCSESKFPITLAQRGYEVYGIDVGHYKGAKNFTFVQGDIRKTTFLNNYFDTITVISTIEHIGLGRYDDPLASEGDKETLGEIKRILKYGGQCLFTIPCGKDTICFSKEGTPMGRVYSTNSLIRLLDGFSIYELAYIVKKGRIWYPASMSDAERAVIEARPEKTGMSAIALINAFKLQ